MQVMGGLRRQLAGALAVGLLSVALAACTGATAGGGAGAGGDGIGGPGRSAEPTVKEADRILASVMATNNKANAALNLALLGGYETGSAFSIDAASYRASRLAHIGGSANIPFGVRVLETAIGPSEAGGSIPSQVTREASFLVVGQTVLETKLPKSQLGPCPNADTLLVFQRSASGHWQIVLEPSADSGRFARLATGKAGVLAQLSSHMSSVAAGVPGRLANALVRYEASGRLGALQKTDFNGSCWAIPDPRAAVAAAQASGFDARQLYSPAGQTFVAPLEGGQALVLFTLSTAETIVAPVGSPIRWRHSSGATWTSLLPAGLYSRITESGDVEIASIVSPDGAYSIVGAYSGWTSISGTTTKAPGPGGPPTLLSFG